MTLGKKLLICLAVLLVAFAAISYSWTYTPHGRLDYRAAVSLKLLSFERVIKPDPEVDFELPIPVNLIYAISFALPSEDVERVEDRVIPGEGGEIPIRIYWPTETEGSKAPPVTVFYHGGGFVVGSIDIFDALTRGLANATGSIVVSVGYRLAPTHPYPAAVNDAFTALRWVADNAEALGGSPSRILVAGESAGANLATVSALRARDEGGPRLAGQILYYPVTDFTDTSYPSLDKFVEGYGFSTESGMAMWDAYLGDVEDLSDPHISPLKAPSLARMPQTLMVSAGFDPLVDSNAAYVERLRESGVAVKHAHYPTVIHGFMNIRVFPQYREALNETGDFVEELFTRNPVGARIRR
jgi:acetyl esterase